MARPLLPLNENNGLVDNDSPGVPATNFRKKIPVYPMVVKHGGFNWSYDGLDDSNLFPSPRKTGWAQGWVCQITRDAMMCHPKVYQGINGLKNAILGDGGRWIPNINPYGPDKSYFKEAVRNMKFLDANYRGINGSHFIATRQMLDCIHEGNKLAPISTREQQSGIFKGKEVLDTLHVWRNQSYRLHRNEFGVFDKVTTRYWDGIDASKGVYSADKFWHLNWRPVNGNPYGSTLLNPVYDPFYEDIQAQFENSAYMSTWGRPSVIIFSAPPPEGLTEDPMPLYYRDGKPVEEPDPDNPGQMRQREGYASEQNAIMFTDFEAGSIWSLAGGSIVQIAEAKAGGAELFRDTRKEARGAIMDVIFGTRHATEGEKSPTAAGAELTGGIQGLNVTEGKMMLEQTDESFIGKQILRFNYGDATATDLMPIRDYGSGQNSRLPKIINAQSTFASNGSLTRAQYWDFCASSEMPLPWPYDEPAIFSLRKLTAELEAKLGKQVADKKNEAGGDATGGGDKSGGAE